MLSIIVAIALSQSLDFSDTPHNQRTRQFFRTGRTSSASFAFFQAFPTSGRGVQQATAYPLPNWVVRSSDFTSASWRKIGTGRPAPVVVASDGGSFYQAPDGTNTAQRITFSQCDGGGQSFVDQLVSLTGEATNSFYVKPADGTTQAVDVCSYANTSCTHYPSVLGGVWTRVTHTQATPGAGNNYTTLGCGGYTGSGLVGSDLLVWGAMVNATTSVSPFVATTTAAKGYTVTGAKGETLTFTRASNAYASKNGLATTGIANGDLVLMPSNQPRVEPDSNGVLGLRVEGSRTNSALRSEEFNNASWSKISGGGAAAPSVTQNYAVAPDGTTTAERVQFAATTGAQYSLVEQTIAAMSNPHRLSIYMKGTSGSGSVDLYTRGAGGSLGSCSFVAESWTRCDTGNTVANTVLGFGNYSLAAGAARSAQDVLVWGAQLENSAAYASSYIPTTSAAATRQAENAYFDLGGAVLPNSQAGSMAATLTSNSVTKDSTYPELIETSATYPPPGPGNDRLIFYSASTYGSTWQCFSGNTAGTGYPSGAAAGATNFRGWCSVDSTITGGLNSTQFVAGGPVAGAAAAHRYVLVGSNSGGYQAFGVVSKVCRDPDPARCR